MKKMHPPIIWFVLLASAFVLAGDLRTTNLQVDQVATLTQTNEPICITGTFATDGPRIDDWNPACLATNSVIAGQAGDNEGTLISGMDAIDAGPSTTIAIASNGQTLPQATINVAATTGFAPYLTNYVIYVTTSAGQQTVGCTGATSATFTGCTGGAGIMSTGGAVLGGFKVGTVRRVCDINGTADAGIINLSLEDANSQPNNRFRAIYQNASTHEDRLIIDSGTCMNLVYAAPVQGLPTVRRWMPLEAQGRKQRSTSSLIETFPWATPAAITGTVNDWNPVACAIAPIGGSCLNSGSTLFEDYTTVVINTAPAATTVAAGSNGAVLPQATINVAATAGFSSTVTIYLNVVSTNGTQLVTCTGLTGTTFTGCSGGSGTLATGNAVNSIEVITGMVGPGGNSGKGQGAIKIVENAGSSTITITNADPASTAGNQFQLPNAFPIAIHPGEMRTFWTSGSNWVLMGNGLSLQGNTNSANHLVMGSPSQPGSPNRLAFSNVVDVNNVTTIGAISLQDVANQNTASSFLGVTPAGTGLTSNAGNDISVLDNRTFNTTAGAITVSGFASVVGATRTAGANNLTNVASIFSANGGQVNYAQQTTGGSEYHGLGAVMPVDYHNATIFDASATGKIETTVITGGGDFTGTTRQQLHPCGSAPTVNHGTLTADSNNCDGRIQTIGANTSFTITFGTPPFVTLSRCRFTILGATPAVITNSTLSTTAPVFSCFDMAGAPLNCPDVDYTCEGH